MKPLLALTLSAVLCLCAAGCGERSVDRTGGTTAAETAETAGQTERESGRQSALSDLFAKENEETQPTEASTLPTTAAPTTAAPTMAASVSIKQAYTAVLKQHQTPDDMGYYETYALYDIDKDGTPELLVRTGNYEAAYAFHVFVYNGNGASEIGELGGSHSALYTRDGRNGIIIQHAHMGYEYNEIVELQNGQLVVTDTDEREIGEGEYSEPGTYIPEYDTVDYAPLNSLS